MKNILILVMPFLFCPSATAAEVVFKTVKGTFVLNIDEEKAPVTAQNFIQYVQDGFFDGLIFSPRHSRFRHSGRRFYIRHAAAPNAPADSQRSGGQRFEKHQIQYFHGAHQRP